MKLELLKQNKRKHNHLTSLIRMINFFTINNLKISKIFRVLLKGLYYFQTIFEVKITKVIMKDKRVNFSK